MKSLMTFDLTLHEKLGSMLYGQPPTPDILILSYVAHASSYSNVLQSVNNVSVFVCCYTSLLVFVHSVQVTGKYLTVSTHSIPLIVTVTSEGGDHPRQPLL